MLLGESLTFSKQLGLRGKQLPCIWAMRSEQKCSNCLKPRV